MAKKKKSIKKTITKKQKNPYSLWIRIIAIIMCALMIAGVFAVLFS